MVSTANSYAALSRRLDGITRTAVLKMPTFCGYSKQDISWRLIQRCAEYGVFRFTKTYAEKFYASGSLPEDGDTVDCDGLRFVGDKRVTLSPMLFVRSFLAYLWHWTLAFATIVFSLRLRCDNHKITLLYGVGIDNLTADGDDRRFVRFCRDGGVAPLSHRDRLAVQATQPVVSCTPASVRYGRVPLFIALRWLGLSPSVWLYAIYHHASAMVSFVRAVLCYPAIILLERDFAYHAAALAMSHRGVLQDVVLTNSNYFSQPLWMWALSKRRHRSHIIWYSQNSYPMAYMGDSVIAPIPNLRFIRADLQWVWTDSFKRFLECIGCTSEIRVVGPIIWQLPDHVLQRESGNVRIAVFDVTPINNATEREWGLIRSYYTELNAVRFINNIVEAATKVGHELGKNVDIFLKHKRPHAAIHASTYLRLISDLEASGKIRLMLPTTNLYDLIDSCDLVIAIPFSSPAYVAASRNILCTWYDPTGKLLPLGDQDNGIPFINDTVRLAELIRGCVRVRRSHSPPHQ